MSIQQDILDTIGEKGIECDALHLAMCNVGKNEIVVAVNAMLRAKRLRITESFVKGRRTQRYEIVLSTRPLGGMPHTGRPPTAEEEAAASLQPRKLKCEVCKDFRIESEFRVVGSRRAFVCTPCHELPQTTAKKSVDKATPDTIKYHSACKRTDDGTEALKVGHPVVTRATSVIVGSIPTSSTNLPVDGSDVLNKAPVALPHTQESGPHPKPADASSLAKEEPPGSAAPGPDRILQIVKARLQATVNRMAILEVELQNLQAESRDCETFLALHERFAAGGI